MARQKIAAQQAGRAGVEITMTNATSDGYAIPIWNGRTCIVVQNGNVSDAITVTLKSTGGVAGLNLEDQDIAVPAGETRYIGGLKPAIHEQPSPDEGHVHLDFGGSDVLTDVDVGAIYLPA